MRGFLVYWQCPRHVMSLGGYPERISPWLVMLPLPCCVQPLLHSCVCVGTQQPPGGVLTLCHSLLQAVSSGAQALFPDICEERHLHGQGKSRIKQQSQNVRLYLCAGDPRGCRSPRSLCSRSVCVASAVQRPWITQSFANHTETCKMPHDCGTPEAQKQA